MSGNKTRPKWWTRRRIINASFLTAFVVAFTITWLIPPAEYGRAVLTGKQVGIGSVAMKYANAPPLSYDWKMTITTNGVFCANNAIDVEVIVSNTNITDFRQHFRGIAFWNAGHVGDDIGDGIPFQGDPKDGVHTAKGSIAFSKETESMVFLIPSVHPQDVPLNNVLTPQQAMFFLNQTSFEIGPVSGALTVQINSFAVKIGFVFATFSLLIIPPVVEGIVIRPKDEK